MTETTDKLTLQQLEDVREICLPKTAWRSIIDELISAREQLEAERQRDEENSEYKTFYEEAIIASNEEGFAGMSAAQVIKYQAEELAALKGEHEPVALVTNKFIAYLPKHGDGERWPVGTKLYAHPVMPVINLNHIGRITAQISGQRYTYFSAEDVRHYFEEIKCEIVERAASSGGTVYIPHQELPNPVVVLPNIDDITIPPELALSGNDTELFLLQYQHYVKLALKDAGIVVKDGELATITCCPCRKSMNLAQHSSNDGLCPHCNVEIDLEE